VGPDERVDHVAVIPASELNRAHDLTGFGALMTDAELDDDFRATLPPGLPFIQKAEHIAHISDGDVLRLDFQRGLVRSLYRVNSRHNSLFATDRCNSNCLMCSQPPKDVDDGGIVDEHLRLISLIPPTTEVLGISGGEPTLLGEGLVRIIELCRDSLPVTRIHMLTNGRTFADRRFAARLAEIRHPHLVLGIPLYADVASHHDYVVQAHGAFDQTMIGLHNLARFGCRLEIRIVVHRQTVERLPKLAEFIYRNLPFVEHVAFMGLEMMGYTKTNLKALWIDPFNYQDDLETAARYLDRAGMHVSIYNHQLCVLRRSLWPFARKSISDFKNIYLDHCRECAVLHHCGGLFKSGEQIHSTHIHPLASVQA
jgi:His-Xaa-Ser system radical SAM maturase HxsC